MNYYNEFDSNAAAWLRELIADKLIPNGVVDERSITEVKPHDLTGFTQCHFFAGIGGWSLALQLVGWPEDRPVWTMSCPCQPFSDAGKGLAQLDERHLWPVAFQLIRKCCPEHVFGEQVAAAIGKGWLDGVSADLESEGYACGATVLGAHSVGSPHQRQRLYWVADAKHEQRKGGVPERGSISEKEAGREAAEPSGRGATGGRVGDAESHDERRDGQPGASGGRASATGGSGSRCGRVGDATSDGRRQGNQDARGRGSRDCEGPEQGSWGFNFWSDSRWINCRDGKHRRVPTESALFPLADGLPYKLARRGSLRPALLKGSGNAIVPQVAAQFIGAFLDLEK